MNIFLTPEDMPRREPVAYTTSESNNAQSSLIDLANFQRWDIRNAFLAAAYFTCVSGCKNTEKN